MNDFQFLVVAGNDSDGSECGAGYNFGYARKLDRGAPDEFGSYGHGYGFGDGYDHGCGDAGGHGLGYDDGNTSIGYGYGDGDGCGSRVSHGYGR